MFKGVMETDSESFRGKLYLLLLDKLVVGAVIALAFIAYDRYRAYDTHRLEIERAEQAASREERAAKIQREFERARLAKDLLPLILDKNADVVARGYILRSALSTGLLDPEAAIEVSHTLHRQGIPNEDIRRIASVALPGGLAAVARLGGILRDEWISFGEYPHWVSSPGKPGSRPELASVVKERILWSMIFAEAMPHLGDSTESRIFSRRLLRDSISGLYFLLHEYNEPGSTRLFQSSSRTLRLIGSLDSVIMDWGPTKEAAQYLGTELSALDLTNFNDINYAHVVLDVIKRFDVSRKIQGHRGIASEMSAPLAKLVVDNSFHHRLPWIEDKASVEQRQKWLAERDAAEAHYWLQFAAGELLSRIGTRARDAESVLVSYVEQLCRDVAGANDAKAVSLLGSRYGKDSPRFAIDVLAAIDTPGSNAALEKIRALGDDRLAAFGELRMALEARKQGRGK